MSSIFPGSSTIATGISSPVADTNDKISWQRFEQMRQPCL